MSRLRRVPGSQKGHGPLVWGLGQQEAPGKQRMPHLSLWRHTCLPLGLNAEAGVWGSPMARRDQPLELGKRNTPQVRVWCMAHLHRFKRVTLCPQEGDVRAHRYTHTYIFIRGL